MKPYVKVIVNPAAGAGSTKRKWPGIRSCLKNAGLSFDYQFTEGKGHGIELAKAAAGNGFRYLVAVGGDGTIHEVANGILQAPNAAETSLGLISTGTGSDLSRSIGAIRSYSHACSALSNPGKLLIDVGLVEYHQDGQTRQRYFINSAGIGFDAKVIEATESMPKFFGGTIPYLTGLARSFIGYRNRSVTMRIGDKSDEIVTVLGIIAANGKYFGGGMKIAPEARLNDNLLDIIIIGNFGKLELLRVFPRIYKGTHMMYHKVRMERDTRVTIESKQPFLLQADGELLGGGPVSFSIHPAALNLAV